MMMLSSAAPGQVVTFAVAPMARHVGAERCYRQSTIQAVVVSQSSDGTICKFRTGFKFNGDEQIVGDCEVA